MKNTHFSYVFLIVVLLISGCKQPKGWKKGIVLEEVIFNKASFPSCHAATIADTPGGLVSAWYLFACIVFLSVVFVV